MTLLWGLAALAWVFRGADGGRWENIRTECLPGLSGLILLLEARGLAGPELMDSAVRVHEMLPGQGRGDAVMQPDNLEAEYVRLFVNRRGGPGVPLCQSCYEEEALLMGPSAEAMQGRLDQAGFAVNARLPPDHLSIQIEYLIALFPEHTAAQTVRERPSAFAGQVLLPWVGRLENRLIEAKASPFFQLCARSLTATVTYVAGSGQEKEAPCFPGQTTQ